MDILLVEQEVEASDTITALQMVLSAGSKRTALLEEAEKLEKKLEEGGVKYIKKARLTALEGGDFKQGTQVKFEGRVCTVLEEIDEDGDITIQDAFDEDGAIVGRLRDVHDELQDIGSDSAEARASLPVRPSTVEMSFLSSSLPTLPVLRNSLSRFCCRSNSLRYSSSLEACTFSKTS